MLVLYKNTDILQIKDPYIINTLKYYNINNHGYSGNFVFKIERGTINTLNIIILPFIFYMYKIIVSKLQ